MIAADRKAEVQSANPREQSQVALPRPELALQKCGTPKRQEQDHADHVRKMRPRAADERRPAPTKGP